MNPGTTWIPGTGNHPRNSPHWMERCILYTSLLNHGFLGAVEYWGERIFWYIYIYWELRTEWIGTRNSIPIALGLNMDQDWTLNDDFSWWFTNRTGSKIRVTKVQDVLFSPCFPASCHSGLFTLGDEQSSQTLRLQWEKLRALRFEMKGKK